MTPHYWAIVIISAVFLVLVFLMLDDFIGDMRTARAEAEQDKPLDE